MHAATLFAAAAGASLLVALWRASVETTTDAGSENPPVITDEPFGWFASASENQMMRASDQLIAMLKRSEGGPLLVPTNLGDGGWTIGYGRFEKDQAKLPGRITEYEAEAMLRVDVDSRGAYWVRRYVRVALSQNQFDALTSMAYNLKPSSFKNIAEAVNRGDDPETVALQYTRPGSPFERGLRKRRGEEIALYRLGNYA